jgi:hypothetical protein
MTRLLPPWLDRIRRIPRRLGDMVFPRYPQALAHSFGRRPPAVDCLIVPDLQPGPDDVAMAERILKAYRLAAQEAREHSGGKDLWSYTRTHQGTFLAILEQGEPRALAEMLCNMNRHDATIGTVQGNHEYRRIQRSPSYRRWLALHNKDKLLSLAEAVGAMPCENPEQGAWGESLHLATDLLVARIEERLAMDIAPPPIDGGLLKIRSSRGLYHERDLNALFTAWSLRRMLGEPATAALCEIGAGSGRVVYWSWRLGFRSLTTYDLPHINAIQSFYLHRSRCGAALVLHGEADLPGPRIALRPYYRFHTDHEMTFDLVLNQDSFPEIHADVVRAYLQRIRQRSHRYFLSINHESRPPSIDADPQLNVPELIAQVGGYHRLSREPYWLRRGYVTELYQIAGEGG